MSLRTAGGAQITPKHIAHIIVDARIQKVLDWLSPLTMYQKQQDILSRRHPDTGSWLLIDQVFRGWVDGECSQRTLWCPGHRKRYIQSGFSLLTPYQAGTGKTVITYVLILNSGTVSVPANSITVL